MVVYDGVGRKREYSYTTIDSNFPMLTQIKISTVSGETWTERWRVDFAYYTADTTDQGSLCDLKTITETRLAAGGDEVKKWYYGNVTERTQHVNSSTGDDRVTAYAYNYRGQLLMRQNPEAPHAVYKLDYLGNVVATGGYSVYPSTSTDPTAVATNRVSLNETVYNSRGQVRTSMRHSITQSNGASADTITTTNWYDGAGRVVKSRGSELTKTVYDSLGRPTTSYTLAIDNDGATSYTDASGVTGDTVLEETQHLYDDSGKTGNLLMSVVIERHPHDTSTTGNLDAVGDGVGVVAVGNSSFKGRGQITAYGYDAIDRQTSSVALGTNGGSTYTRSSDTLPGTRSDSRLITTTVYNSDGTVYSTTDPRGLVTVHVYDAAGRTTRTVANYVDNTPGGGTNGDEDQVTEYTYVNGLMSALTAKMPGSGDDQTTTYTYGVTTGSTPASALASNRLLQKVQYPDSAGRERRGAVRL